MMEWPPRLGGHGRLAAKPDMLSEAEIDYLLDGKNSEEGSW